MSEVQFPRNEIKDKISLKKSLINNHSDCDNIEKSASVDFKDIQKYFSETAKKIPEKNKRSSRSEENLLDVVDNVDNFSTLFRYKSNSCDANELMVSEKDEFFLN